MTDLYCVFGNPIAHSKSPAIHAAFAHQTGQDLHYEARLAAVGHFSEAVAQLVADGGRGANVTVPFKEDAWRLATRRTPRAEAAGAVNTLVVAAQEILGDNTDGAGLVRDIVHNQSCPLAGKRVLLLGAGGAARGVILPLLAEQPQSLHIANRSADKAVLLAETFRKLMPTTQAATSLGGGSFAALAGSTFDVVINATSASLGGESLPLPPGVFAPGALAHDMMYGRDETPFLAQARQAGVERRIDGLGMLVEQAAEAFFLWRQVRPETAPVLAGLRHALNHAAA